MSNLQTIAGVQYVAPVHVSTDDEIFCHELCAKAEEALSKGGFLRHAASMGSEATYWSYPGRVGLLRLAAHAGETRKHHRSDMPVVARLTFSPRTKFGTFDAAENQMASSIGWFFLRSTAAE